MLCTKFVKIWPIGCREEVKDVKSLQTNGGTDGRSDGRRTAGDQKISLKILVKKCIN